MFLNYNLIALELSAIDSDDANLPLLLLLVDDDDPDFVLNISSLLLLVGDNDN